MPRRQLSIGGKTATSNGKAIHVITKNDKTLERDAKEDVRRVTSTDHASALVGFRRADLARRSRPAAGFTLIELLVVMIIISILLGFIFVASMDATHRAEERATQSLVTKLEGGLNDRLEALLQNVPDPNFAHGYLAAIYYNSNGPLAVPPLYVVNPATGAYQYYPGSTGIPLPNTALTQNLRAKAIATTDFIKSQMPDVFFVQNDSNYPINFAANGFPAPSGGRLPVTTRPSFCRSAILYITIPPVAAMATFRRCRRWSLPPTPLARESSVLITRSQPGSTRI